MTDHDAQRIFCIVGSLRSQSINRRLLHEAMDVVPAQHLCDEYQGLKAVPPFDADDQSAVPGEVDEMCSLIAAADAVLVATPEYNGSVPGQLKNAVDWASRPFATSVLRGKPCAVIGASPGPGGARSAICDLQRILERSGADVIADTVCIPRATELFNRSDCLPDSGLRGHLTTVLESLIAAARGSADRNTIEPPK